MSGRGAREKARATGLRLERPDATGGMVPISPFAHEALTAALGRESRMPDRNSTARCFVPEFLENGRAWGITLQLYELRSHRNWGIGDFADLAAFCVVAARSGADFVGLNPLHAPFTADPGRCSPFAPSSRLFLNPLYIAVDLLDPSGRHRPPDADLARLRDLDLVDYPGVAEVKLRALRAIHAEGGTQALRSGKAEAFVAAGGEMLRRHAIFEALSHHMAANGHAAGWRDWPQPLRDASSAEVATFADRHADEVAFQLWLQWVARTQLDAAAAAGREAGLRIGLYLDVAVGEAPDGSATWSAPADYLQGVTVGAPPDVFSTEGQNWGLAALSPRRLEADSAASFARLVDAGAPNAGAVRIDHAMALRQLFLVPEGRDPADGAYVEYPLGLMIDGLAQVSQRNRLLVIGEDLGSVPPGFREAMERAGMLSYRILYFEQDEGGFIRPGDYPRLSLACLSTHDLPTLAGWWQGHDLDLRERHGLVDAVSTEAQRRRRERERQALTSATGFDGGDRDLSRLAAAVHRFVARTASVLAAVRLADIAGVHEPTNLPGTSDSYPNWRRKLAPTLEEFERLDRWQDITAVMREERPRRP